MRHTIGGLAALLLGSGLLLLGHGMLISLLSIRGNLEGFGAELIGGIGTAYYLGFFRRLHAVAAGDAAGRAYSHL